MAAEGNTIYCPRIYNMTCLVVVNLHCSILSLHWMAVDADEIIAIYAKQQFVHCMSRDAVQLLLLRLMFIAPQSEHLINFHAWRCFIIDGLMLF